MAAIPTSRTGPERTVERLLRSLRCRYQRNRPDLVGQPDFVLKESRSLIFVHGCFWHRHAGCSRATTPQKNGVAWQTKFENTITRDRRSGRQLRSSGWHVMVIWECQLKPLDRVERRITSFLEKHR